MTDTDTPYARIGGADAVRRLAQRFYALVDAEPEYRALRDLHRSDLDAVSESLAGFLSGWLGGPRDWFVSARGCIFSLHAPVAVTAETARQWGDAMARAIAADPAIPDDIGAQLTERLGAMAQAMAPRAAATG